MSVTHLKRFVRRLGIFFLVLFAACLPLRELYFRWDSNRLIQAYGVDPVSVRYRYSFPAEYIQEQLQPGMTREEVHQLIHTYWKAEVVRDADGKIEAEVYFFDPLQTLFGWIAYENGRFKPHANFDRAEGLDLYILVAFFAIGVGLSMASFFPFQWFVRSKKKTSA